MGITAEQDSGKWVLNGHKWIANFLDSDYIFLYVKTEPDDDALDNISAFFVLTEGFEVEELWETHEA